MILWDALLEDGMMREHKGLMPEKQPLNTSPVQLKNVAQQMPGSNQHP